MRNCQKHFQPWRALLCLPYASPSTAQSILDTLRDSPSTRALVRQLPMTLTLAELNGNEKYARLPEALPTDAIQPGALQTGDLMLYGANCLVLFYQSFPSSYSYTPLGQIEHPDGLASVLGAGSVTVTLSILP